MHISAKTKEMSLVLATDSEIKMEDGKTTSPVVTLETLEQERALLMEQDDEMNKINAQELRELRDEAKEAGARHHEKMVKLSDQVRDLTHQRASLYSEASFAEARGMTDESEIKRRQMAEIKDKLEQVGHQHAALAAEYFAIQDDFKAKLCALRDKHDQCNNESFKKSLDLGERKAKFETETETKYLDKEAKAVMEPFTRAPWPTLHLYFKSSITYKAMGDVGIRTIVPIKTDVCTFKVIGLVRSERDRVTIQLKAMENCAFIRLKPRKSASWPEHPQVGTRFCLSFTLEQLKRVEQHVDGTMSLAIDFHMPGYGSVWECYDS